MKIIEALKSETSRVTVNVGFRWLYWDDMSKTYIVRERRSGRSQKIHTVVETPSEENAVEALIGS